MAKCFILAGNYGSGKTEISLNLALGFSGQGKTALADMDIVNPYFRSAEHKAMLDANGIKLIAPTYANTLVDAPVISAEVFSAFSYEYAVFDAGGDPVGTSVMGSISAHFSNQEDVRFYYVVNARRPLQKTGEQVTSMLKLIQAKARMPITGLINNTNLARETTVEDLLYGREICLQVSARTGIPIVYTSGEAHILKEYASKTREDNLLTLKIYTRPNWLDSTI